MIFRSTEEIFSLFITFAFSADAIKDTIKGNDNVSPFITLF